MHADGLSHFHVYSTCKKPVRLFVIAVIDVERLRNTLRSPENRKIRKSLDQLDSSITISQSLPILFHTPASLYSNQPARTSIANPLYAKWLQLQADDFLQSPKVKKKKKQSPPGYFLQAMRHETSTKFPFSNGGLSFSLIASTFDVIRQLFGEGIYVHC